MHGLRHYVASRLNGRRRRANVCQPPASTVTINDPATYQSPGAFWIPGHKRPHRRQ